MGVAEIDAVRAQGVQLVGQAGKQLGIEVGALQALGIDVHQVRPLALHGLFRRLVVGGEIGGIADDLALDQQRDVLKRRGGADRKQRQQHGDEAVGHAAAFGLAAQQAAGQHREDKPQRRQQADKRQHVFADARAFEAAGDGVNHRVGDAVAGKVVAGDQNNVQHQIAAEQRQQNGEPPAVGGGPGAINQNRRQEENKRNDC